MTILAAYTDGVTTWIGSDLATTDAAGNLYEVPRKWLGAEGWWYGHTGDLRVLNLIERSAIPLLHDVKDPAEFIERLKRLYEDSGVKAHYHDDHGAGCYGNGGLLVRAGEIWDIDEGLGVLPIAKDAVWCRGSAALIGAAAAWGFQRVAITNPHELVSVALMGAARFNAHIRGVWQETVHVAAGT
jgi:hypothetical protein